MRPDAAHRPAERGQVAGIEVLPFGFFILVVITLFITSMWTVIDTKLAVASAARDGARAYVESSADMDAVAVAGTQARQTLAAYGRAPDAAIDVAASAGAVGAVCGEVTVAVSTEVSLLSLPWLGGLPGTITSTASHSELLDSYRSNAVCQ